ncbi:hypothetical protein [Ructibacterium gallinarum]|uniref:hypothetical protein n=1 Tax=Ructibacterium gallinarum TaxID=2779355 RepID=UPI001CF8A588|nr:hypothetical protein [Ructibacterium gallinarum]
MESNIFFDKITTVLRPFTPHTFQRKREKKKNKKSTQKNDNFFDKTCSFLGNSYKKIVLVKKITIFPCKFSANNVNL